MKKIYDVMVVGELNIDLILNQIESFPEIGKEKIAGQMSLTLGSSSAIFASNLSSLGIKTAFIGKVGQDSFADLVLSSLQAKKVDTSLIIQDKTLATGATIVLNFGEDRANITHPGAMDHLSFSDIPLEKITQAKHLHFSSCFLQPKIFPDLAKLFKFAKELGLTTSLDTQWDPAEKWDFDAATILPVVDVFMPNELEALHLSREKTLDAALDKLALLGNIIIIKMGNKGSICKCGDKLYEAAPFLNKNVVDAIGAGDSFNAGFISKYVKGCDIEQCLKFGNLTGAISTTRAGGTAAFTTQEEIMIIAKERFGFTE
ncbi:MAG TPA: carbohydrate kinase family protein [bacterium]|nr:carbohydrate kinase family protein [bacterium]HPN43568.1 carbohydrate kinase family protein [bacterium]